MHLNPRIAALLNRLNNPSLPGIDLSLDRMWQLLAALDNPQKKLPPVIHVAGTNGKGSTIAYLRAIYAAAGYRVHAYTSPHLVRFNERVMLAGTEISDDALLGYLERITVAARSINVTFFEATTALAFLAFSEHAADVVLLETGLGGRLDATNVVANPIACVITPIDFDHQEFLGATLAAIAGEKAGIMKKNTPCVTAIQQPDAAAALRTQAQAIGAPLLLGGDAWHFTRNDNGFAVQVGEEFLTLPSPNLLGGHQCANAALAAVVAGICADDLPVTNTAIANGISTAFWPARLQKLSHGPMVEQWAPYGDVMLDGGHNPHAANAIADWAKTRSTASPIVLIAAMMKRKNAVDFFAPIAPHITQLLCIPMPEDTAGYTGAELAAAAREAGVMNVSHANNLAAAMAQLRDVVSPEMTPALLIAGSLHLAGEVLKNHS